MRSLHLIPSEKMEDSIVQGGGATKHQTSEGSEWCKSSVDCLFIMVVVDQTKLLASLKFKVNVEICF